MKTRVHLVVREVVKDVPYENFHKTYIVLIAETTLNGYSPTRVYRLMHQVVQDVMYENFYKIYILPIAETSPNG